MIVVTASVISHAARDAVVGARYGPLLQAGRALTRSKILDEVWGDDLIVTERSVDRCVNTLRGKVEADAQRPRFIQTIRDVGYRFEIES